MLSDFEVLDVISSKGKKNNIKILKAKQSKSGEIVCLKTFKSHKFSIVQEALHEAKVLMAASKTHSNICEMKDCFIEQVNDFFRFSIVMQHFEHGDLEDEIKRRKRANRPFSEEELMSIIEGLLDALSVLQKNKICHRDLKPQNIFVENEVLYKIGDFGLSKKEEFGRLNSSKSVVGTPIYFSPLCAEAYLKHHLGGGMRVSHNMYKSDVFSFGLTLLRMASLSSIRGLNCSPQDLIENKIMTLAYSHRIRSLIHYMLQIDETMRPDFIQLPIMNRELNSIMLSIQPDFIREEDFDYKEIDADEILNEERDEEVLDCCNNERSYDEDTLDSFGMFLEESIVVFKEVEFDVPAMEDKQEILMIGADLAGERNPKGRESRKVTTCCDDVTDIFDFLESDPKLLIVNVNSIYLS